MIFLKDIFQLPFLGKPGLLDNKGASNIQLFPRKREHKLQRLDTKPSPRRGQISVNMAHLARALHRIFTSIFPQE